MSVWNQLLLLFFCLLITGGNIVLATIVGMLIYWGIEKLDSHLAGRYKDKNKYSDDLGDYYC